MPVTHAEANEATSTSNADRRNLEALKEVGLEPLALELLANKIMSVSASWMTEIEQCSKDGVHILT